MSKETQNYYSGRERGTDEKVSLAIHIKNKEYIILVLKRLYI